MTASIKIALAQINPTVGAIDANLALVRTFRTKAAEAGADIVVFPELAILGYPPEDLVLKPALQRVAGQAIQALAADTADGGPAVIVGCSWREGDALHNSAIALDEGDVKAAVHKQALPNYGVFDEKRVLSAGQPSGPVMLRGVRLGVMICEDMWRPNAAECLQETGAEVLVVLNGSPFESDKLDERQALAAMRARESDLPLLYVNQVGGQDELVFDGASFLLDSDGKLCAQLDAWRESLGLCELTEKNGVWHPHRGEAKPQPVGLEALYLAMMTGLRDYVGKNGFPGIVIGLSGGIDSALSAAVAVDALGPDKVRCVMMPSRYTSTDSLEDAAGCAGYLGCRLDEIAIEGLVEAFDAALGPLFEGTKTDTTEENVQARARAVLLMAISNKFGDMVLTTGNKSEMLVGYATLYGDMCGGFSVLKDVYKTDVFALSEWRNAHFPDGALGPDGAVMPVRVITKPPTAELRPDQRDDESLPSYDVLDDILECLVEHEMSNTDIAAKGHNSDVVARIEHLLYIAEYKRRQAPPGVKLTRRNFGRDRRYPITNGFRSYRNVK